MKTLISELTILNTNMTALNNTRESSQTKYEFIIITAFGMTVGLLMVLIPDLITTINFEGIN